MICELILAESSNVFRLYHDGVLGGLPLLFDSFDRQHAIFFLLQGTRALFCKHSIFYVNMLAIYILFSHFFGIVFSPITSDCW